MEANEIILQGTTETSLVGKIKMAIKEVLAENLKKPEPDNDLLTRDEVCQLLNINKTTLWHYTKQNKLQSYGIGNRVYYKKDEVLNAVKPLKK
ncbi:MAG: helix-turn-helix domain-containing protein [Saonia sp.]